MTGKVKCTCGWSWNKSDSSKKDMYICHECGRDNSNNMKDGGWLDNYNDSEVSLPEGFVGEGIFNGPKFDNPAWGGQFQNGGWLEKIDNVLSAPARAATYAIEAGAHAIGARKAPPKYEDPSDGLGIDEKKHPYLKLATNIVLDPTNLLGVGAISKIGKLAKGIKTVEKTKNVLQPAVKTAFDAATKAGKASGAITWGRNLGKQHRAFFKEYDVLLKNMYKPEVVEQALKLGAKDAIGVSAIINDLIKQHPEKKEEILKNYKNISKQNTNKNPQQQVIVKPTTTKETTKPFVPDQGWTDPNTGIHWTEKPIEQNIPQKRKPIQTIQNTKLAGLVHEDLDIEADISQLRQQVKQPKYYNVQENINQNFGGSQTNYQVSDLKNITGPENLGKGNTRKITPVYQMGGSIPGAVGHMYARTGSPSKGPRRNQTDVTDASAQNGKEMQYYQNGLDWKPKSISKNGAWLDNYKEEIIIKDDRGQWDHPGEITEINSNDITMQGVPFDVLGVSDTGDTKLMKPGKNYKFKGKKVTEYPMAKNGVNQQDQKTLQQLDQLTNFTNYNKPTIGGWLNKYN